MTVRILEGDCREVLHTLPDESVHCIVTSPPYFNLRNYDVDGQLGLEETPDAFIAGMVAVFRECRRVLREDGVLFLNIGDSYSGGGRGGNPGSSEHQKQRTNAGSISVRHVKLSPFKDKDLIGIPWALAFALRADGWYLRSEIIWAKPNGMPGSQQDRCTSSHETVFMLSKSRCYWSDFDAIKTPPRESTLVRTAQDLQAQAGSHRANGGGMERSEQQQQPAMMRDVWFIPPDCNKLAHFAMMPRELARRCILAGSPVGGVVLDPFAGAGTTGLVADRLQRDAVLIELNPAYAEIARKRIAGDSPLFADVA